MSRGRIVLLTVMVPLFLIINQLNSDSLKNHEQEVFQKPATFAWFTFGLGAGSDIVKKEGAGHSLKSFTIQQGIFNMSIRTYHFFEIMDESDERELALMLGLNKKGKRSVLAFGLGPGKVFPDGGVSGNFSEIGLAFEVQYVWAITKFFGIGGYIFGNLNKHSLTNGFCLSLQVGKLR